MVEDREEEMTGMRRKMNTREFYIHSQEARSITA
jgi:hypothetical protein